MKGKRLSMVLTILASTLLIVQCAAANMVTNGGFETGDFTGWTITPAASGSFLDVDSNWPHSGVYGAFFGAYDYQDDSISQTISTVPGQSYTFDFWISNLEYGNDHFQAFWDGASVLDLFDSPAFDYTYYSFIETASGPSTTIQFSSYDIVYYYDLDDVSVNPVPEPSAFILFGTGMAGVGILGRRFRK
ncbi:MAG: PEP-CTERM sorting domain-containing protein [Nitrospirales bacterium]|nr:PEP-CTERM sorting domain-containing protein [Nitrospirales bacterium]